jgi:glutathione synthase/RimK-type ligase-like ATP-grasp enzyme
VARKNKKHSVGYVYFKSAFDATDKAIFKAFEKKFNLITLPFEDQIDLDAIRLKVKECKIVLNYSTSEEEIFESMELTKALEELGKKVINSSKSFFYQEDKWMFYLKCLEHRLPTPKTYLIPKEHVKSKLIKDLLNTQQLVLKAVFSDNGLCVRKVATYPMFLKRMKEIIHNNPVSPIIAQQYIPNADRSYRVTLIGHRIVQAVAKIGHSWKQTGCEKNEHVRKIKVTKELREICEKASRVLGMELCGVDLLLNDGKWYIIEANSCPGLDFIYRETYTLAEELADYIYKMHKKI